MAAKTELRKSAVLPVHMANFPAGMMLGNPGGVAAAPQYVAIPVGSSGAANVTPDTPPVSANSADDEFTVGSALDTLGARFSGAIPWTINNAHASTTLIKYGALLSSGVTGNLNDDIVYSQPIANPTNPWEIFCSMPSQANGTFAGVWCGFQSTGQGAYFGNDVGTIYIITQTTYAGAGAGAPGNGAISGNVNVAGSAQNALKYGIYFLMGYDGTNIYFKASPDGRIFVTCYQATPAALMGGTPTHFGLMRGDNTGITIPCAAWDFFRRTL